ncbi:MAG: hypothetical protein U5Q03_13670 [Bacteroidota bacterium]|nr:hypothetical protein [Bacteroidota bacterium]
MELNTFDRKQIEKIISKSNRILFLFLGAYRFYDQLWTAISKNNNIKVYKLQHGFEIDSVFYKPLAVISKLIKSTRLIFAAYNLAKGDKIQCYIRSWSAEYSSDTCLKEQDLKILYWTTILLILLKLLYITKYYIEFWHNKFGIDKSSMSIITPQDFLLISDALKKEKISMVAVIYLETLVEDRRMSVNDFNKMLDGYENLSKSCK